MTQIGMESHHRVANDITPLKSFRAWVGPQCERIGETLALRNDVRFLTFLKPELDAKVEAKLLNDHHNS